MLLWTTLPISYVCQKNRSLKLTVVITMMNNNSTTTKYVLTIYRKKVFGSSDLGMKKSTLMSSR